MATLNRSIQRPGFGSTLSQAGCQLRTRYGEAKPTPTVSRMRIVMTGLLRANAKPMAAPRNGAEQEVARTVAKSPLKNAPAAPCLEARLVAAVSAPEPRVISKTPKRFRAISVTRVVM